MKNVARTATQPVAAYWKWLLGFAAVAAVAVMLSITGLDFAGAQDPPNDPTLPPAAPNLLATTHDVFAVAPGDSHLYFRTVAALDSHVLLGQGPSCEAGDMTWTDVEPLRSDQHRHLILSHHIDPDSQCAEVRPCADGHCVDQGYQFVLQPVPQAHLLLTDAQAVWDDDPLHLRLTLDVEVGDENANADSAQYTGPDASDPAPPPLSLDIWANPFLPGVEVCEVIHYDPITVQAQPQGNAHEYKVDAAISLEDMLRMGMDPLADEAKEYCLNARISDAHEIEGQTHVTVPVSPDGVAHVQWHYSDGIFFVDWQYTGDPDGAWVRLIEYVGDTPVLEGAVGKDIQHLEQDVCLDSGITYELNVRAWKDINGSFELVGPAYVDYFSGTETCQPLPANPPPANPPPGNFPPENPPQ